MFLTSKCEVCGVNQDGKGRPSRTLGDQLTDKIGVGLTCHHSCHTALSALSSGDISSYELLRSRDTRKVDAYIVGLSLCAALTLCATADLVA